MGVIQSKEKLIQGNTKRSYCSGGNFNSIYDIDTTDTLEMNGRYNIASVGEGVVRVVLRDENITPQMGDLIISTDLIVGYAELQDDDVIRSKTIGKLTCNWDYEYLDEVVVNGYKTKFL